MADELPEWLLSLRERQATVYRGLGGRAPVEGPDDIKHGIRRVANVLEDIVVATDAEHGYTLRPRDLSFKGIRNFFRIIASAYIKYGPMPKRYRSVLQPLATIYEQRRLGHPPSFEEIIALAYSIPQPKTPLPYDPTEAVLLLADMLGYLQVPELNKEGVGKLLSNVLLQLHAARATNASVEQVRQDVREMIAEAQGKVVEDTAAEIMYTQAEVDEFIGAAARRYEEEIVERLRTGELIEKSTLEERIVAGELIRTEDLDTVAHARGYVQLPEAALRLRIGEDREHIAELLAAERTRLDEEIVRKLETATTTELMLAVYSNRKEYAPFIAEIEKRYGKDELYTREDLEKRVEERVRSRVSELEIGRINAYREFLKVDPGNVTVTLLYADILVDGLLQPHTTDEGKVKELIAKAGALGGAFAVTELAAFYTATKRESTAELLVGALALDAQDNVVATLRTYFKRGNYDRLSALLQQGVAHSPGTDKILAYQKEVLGAWYELGRKEQREGRVEGATSFFTRIIELHPRHARAHLRLAECYHTEGKLKQAKPLYERALSLDGSLTEAQQGLDKIK